MNSFAKWPTEESYGNDYLNISYGIGYLYPSARRTSRILCNDRADDRKQFSRRCSRESGHLGPHVNHGRVTGRAFAVWGDEDLGAEFRKSMAMLGKLIGRKLVKR